MRYDPQTLVLNALPVLGALAVLAWVASAMFGSPAVSGTVMQKQETRTGAYYLVLDSGERVRVSASEFVSAQLTEEFSRN